MDKKTLQLGILFVILVAGLNFTGFLAPSCLNWGFHSFGFLPGLFFVLYIGVLAAIIMHLKKRDMSVILSRASNLMAVKPYHFLGFAIAVFIIFAYIFRSATPLLGDGFFLLRNYSEALRDAAPVYPRNEPFATFYYYSIVKLMGVTSYAEFMNAFFTANLILGISFIIIVFHTVRNLFDDNVKQLLAFLFLHAVPYMQLFFGYVETYGAILVLIALYALTALLLMRKKATFLLVAFVFLMMVLTHYLSILLLPSFLLLTWRVFKTYGYLSLIKGYGLITGIIGILLFMINFDIGTLSAYVPHSHFLPLTPSQDPVEAYSEAYTMLSIGHGTDILNFIILLCLPSLYLIFISLRGKIRDINTEENIFLMTAVIPTVIFYIIIKFDLGAAKDWDVFAPFCFLLVVLAVNIYLKFNTSANNKLFLLITSVALLTSLIFIVVNANTNSSVERYKSLLDKRSLSNFGLYSSSLSLAMHYHEMNDPPNSLIVWEKYSKQYPKDQQGYYNIINNLKNFGADSLLRIERTFREWIDAIPDDTLAFVGLSRFFLDAGNIYYEKNFLENAKIYYFKALLIMPTFERAYNNLGSVYAQEGKTDTAIVLFSKAIELDSSYADAYFNLGNLYIDQGQRKIGNEYITSAARLGNQPAQEYLRKEQNK